MGNEMKCRVRCGKQESEGQALLETSEIIFRGGFRLKLPFSGIQSAKAVKGELHLRSKDGLAIFELGSGTAQKWLDKILHPKSRIEKLGVKPNDRVAFIGFGDADQEFISEVKNRSKMLVYDSKSLNVLDTDWIFFKAETPKELGPISKIAKGMRGATGLWAIYPKGGPKKSDSAGKTDQKITESNVLTAGRAAGLKDVKVVGFSSTHTALKFVIPVSER